MEAPTTKKVVQPKWHEPIKPSPSSTPVLKLYNSLTRTKNEFIPNRPGQVTWYSCGPTVYDSSHMGHARNYVSSDINRRILQDYFGYNIKFIQNVTDIDDKIIIRARQSYLFEKFIKDFDQITPELVSKTKDGLEYYIDQNLPEAPKDYSSFKNWYSSIDVNAETIKNPKFPMHLKSIKLANESIFSSSTLSLSDYLSNVKDVIVPQLDKEFGSTVSDPEVFRALPAFWEKKYDEDMAALNVLPSTITTRVSEYVEEIIEYVAKIIDNGYAYVTSDGSVYFDTVKFEHSEEHDYAKLQPWSKGDLSLIEDGEGSLSASNQTKRTSSDFALWKTSKPGEPSWSSPWGTGRPGWHIECSVMASDLTGNNMDIHSGGIDLCFPHHDNELAQSEAYYNNKQWVNYFMHCGHLHIQGQKMSKSLKNFITIEEALKSFSSRQLRLVFASTQWNSPLDFKDSLIQEVKSLESSLSKFFTNIRALNNDYKYSSNEGKFVSKKVGASEKKLLQDLEVAQDNTHIAFCDNLATPQVLKVIQELIIKSNTYIAAAGSDIKMEPLLAVTFWITKVLSILGFETRSDRLGWLDSTTSTAAVSSIEEIASPFVKVLSSFRDLVRKSAIEQKPYQDFLTATDLIRDQDLLKLGVSLDDRTDGQSALIKFLNQQEQNELIKQTEMKEQQKKEKELKKLQQKLAKEKQEKEKAEKAKVSPKDLFKNSDEYSEWDENGLPTKDKDGNEVTKSARKKLQKQYDQQKKLHDEYLKTIGDN